MVTTTLLTAEDLAALPDTPLPNELWRGVLRPMTLTGGPHGSVSVRLAVAVAQYVYARDLGDPFSEGTAFVLERDPDTVFCPDFAFVAKGRLPAAGLEPGVVELVPDLAVEVLSTSNRPGEVREKVAIYLRLGVRAVWVVDPRKRTVRIHTSGGEELLSAGDDLDGGGLLPGFRYPVAELFSRLRR